MRLLGLMWIAIVLGAAMSVTGAAASDEMADDEMLMMSVMSGGIEEVPEGAQATLSVAAVLASTPGDFQTIDVAGAAATRAFGINPAGDVVGSYTNATGTYGYLWSDGEITTIAYPGAVFTEAWGINARVDIVGRYRLAGDPRTFGFLLSDGEYTDISVGDHMHTLPTKIGATGEIVGCIHDTNFLRDMRGYIQRGDTVTLFEPLPSSMHNGVTQGGGLIAGISFDSPLEVHSYVLDRGDYTQFDYPGQTFTQAWDVSPSGTVVGYYDAFFSHGFARDADGLRQVDVPGARLTRIFGINAQGTMVGVYADAALQFHGFAMRG